jgi:hypothetical protein
MNEVKQKMIEELEWTIDYHSKKLEEAKQRLELIEKK